MKKFFLSLILLCLFASLVQAQDWVRFTQANPEAPIITLIQSDNQQVEFTIEVCGMFKTDINEEGESFQRIEIPGAGKTDETGEPELPYIRQLIAIPECDNVVLSVNITGQTDFNNFNIYPAPDYEEIQNPDSSFYLQEVFYKNDTVYEQNIYLPGINAEIISMGYLRSQKYAEIYIYPIQFNPVTQHIEVYSNYQITLNFINPTTDVNLNTGIFNNVASNTMLNYVSSGIRASVNDNVQGNGNVQWVSLTSPSQADNIVADYLIICAEDFFQPNEPNSEVLRIANHRASYNGFDVVILDANNIISDELGFFYEGLNQVPPSTEFKKEQRIRTCIRRVYEGENAQHTYDGKLGYVLLIGDSEYGSNLGMPTSKDDNPGASIEGVQYPSDYYYSCLTSIDGDYDDFGELFVGRFCVDNNLINGLTELHNLVSKTIYFESEATFEGWRDQVGVLIGEEFTHLGYMYEYFNFMDDLVPTSFTVDKLDPSDPNFTKQDIYDVFNTDGVSLFIYYGHGDKRKWLYGSDFITSAMLEANLDNSNKPPVVLGNACYTGYFDYDIDCFGEILTTYSETEGFVGYLGGGRMTRSSYGSINVPPIELQELLPYTIFEHLSHITGEYILESKMLSHYDCHAFAYNYFGDPALNIMAQGFEVTHNITLADTTIISNEITVKNGATLTIPQQGQLRFEDNGKLIIEEGATVEFLNHSEIMVNNISEIINEGDMIIGSNVEFEIVENGGLEIVSNGNLEIGTYSVFSALEGSRNKLIINGDFSIDSHPYFIAVEDSELEIKLNNISIQDTFNYAIFERCKLSVNAQDIRISNTIFNICELSGYAQDLTIENNSTFTDCDLIYFFNANVNISNSDFTDSWLYVDNFEDNSLTATISDCDFSNNSFYTQAGIYLFNYDQYEIDDNTIDGYYNGIHIVQSGYGLPFEQIIMNNSINNCGNSGIMTYNSISDIYKNHIFDNRYGVWFGNRSSTKLHGYFNAGTNEETQLIKNNDDYEVYASEYSFPIDFFYNAIFDVENLGIEHDPLVYYDTDPSGFPNMLNVMNNYWGLNFNPAEDLYPAGWYNYLPIWTPGLKNTLSPTEDEVLYENANTEFEAENFIQAKTLYQSLIEQYPESIFAGAAMKELFRLEQFAGNNYAGLKEYCLTNEVIGNYPQLAGLSEFLANKCNIELENWQEAIDNYETVIQNPESAQDSIFAIVDLGNLYFIMANSGTKSGYTCTMPEYIFKSKEEYAKNRDYLLSLLPMRKSDQLPYDNFEDIKAGELSQNVPNPCADVTSIYYSLEEAASVSIKVYNHIGMQQKLIEMPNSETGVNKIELNTSEFPAGIYFYSLIIDGKVSDTKKMVVVK
ncbi:MAG: T9SS type A sorting domain-containing protein [Bacteroidales bacterium]|nr:T9SS type A sorting domain-containing protein [Bacteroidales bacterium]